MASADKSDPFSLLSSSFSNKTGESNVNGAQQSSDMSWDTALQYIKKAKMGPHNTFRRTPTDFMFYKSDDGSGRKINRLYFLGTGLGAKSNLLSYINLPDTCSTQVPQATWHQLADGPSPGGRLSQQEQLLRERQRQCSVGVTDYHLQPGVGVFVYSAPGTNIMSARDPSSLPAGEQQCTNTGVSGLDAKLTEDGKLFSYVRNSELWVKQRSGNPTVRVSPPVSGKEAKSYGLASFAVQEEFDRCTGSWWHSSSKPNVYYLLYEAVDESDVKVYHIVADDEALEYHRYPRVGTANALCDLYLAEVTLDSNGLNSRSFRLPLSLTSLFPSAEYLLRAGWAKDLIYVQLLNRTQDEVKMVLFDRSAFSVSLTSAESSEPSGFIPFQVVLNEASCVWISPHDSTVFLSSDHVTGHVQFVWCSARTGFRHLYVHTADVSRLCDSTLDQSRRYESSEQTSVALTSGEWQIERTIVGCHQPSGWLYFMGSRHSVIESHLYAVNIQRPESIHLLTSRGYSHDCQMSSAGDFFITSYSSLSSPPACTVYELHQRGIDSVTATPLCHVLLQSPALVREVNLQYTTPEHHVVNSCTGEEFHVMVIPPKDRQPNIQYPTLLYCYGGPDVQLVTNTFKGARFYKLHSLAAKGYCILMADCRGSSGRGLQFESYLKNSLGQIEVEDQVEVVKTMIQRLGYIDPSRVAIHGWSYGGYLSLLALAQRPDIFKLAVAGAPVTTWELYDTAYTERYIGTPTTQPEAFDKGSVLLQAKRFPREHGRLLIIHGLSDENVHFSHTSKLVKILINAGIPHQLQVYPDERHGLRSTESSEHFETLFFSFLQQNL